MCILVNVTENVLNIECKPPFQKLFVACRPPGSLHINILCDLTFSGRNTQTDSLHVYESRSKVIQRNSLLLWFFRCIHTQIWVRGLVQRVGPHSMYVYVNGLRVFAPPLPFSFGSQWFLQRTTLHFAVLVLVVVDLPRNHKAFCLVDGLLSCDCNLTALGVMLMFVHRSTIVIFGPAGLISACFNLE